MTSWPAPQTLCCHCCDELTACCCRIRLPLLTERYRLVKIYNVWSMTYCLLTCRNYASTYWTTRRRRLLDSFVQRLVTVILYPCRSSLCGNYWARATQVPWTTEKLVWAAVADSHDHTLFCSLHVQWAEHCVCFVVHFVFRSISDGGNCGLRLRVIILLRQYGFDVCLFVCLWWVDRLFVTSRLRGESTGWRVDWQP